MAKVTYIGPNPAEVYVMKSGGHRVLNNGVAEEVKEPENLAIFLKLDHSAVKIEASKAELIAAEELAGTVRHICSLCKKEWRSQVDYLSHECPARTKTQEG